MKKQVFTILLSLAALTSWAQESRTAYNFLRLPISAHAAALGGENITISDDDATLVFNNPALLQNITDKTLNLNMMTYMQGTVTASASFARAWGERASWGISGRYMDYGQMKETDITGEETGSFGARDVAIGGTISYGLTNSISGGVNLKIISESIKDMGGVGVALDAGIQYVTGPYDNVHFGITLKNIGPTMKFSGDGISLRVFMDHGNQQFTMVQRADDFELPTQLSIAAGYDFILGETSRLTVAGNFCSNSFTNDQFTLGMEYGFKDLFMVRAGYTYENGIWSKGGFQDNDGCMNINGGLSAGVSVQVPLSKKENGLKLAVDYSYRDTYVFNGTHSVGARIFF